LRRKAVKRESSADARKKGGYTQWDGNVGGQSFCFYAELVAMELPAKTKLEGV